MKKGTVRSINHDKLFTDWFEVIYESNFEGLYRYAFSIVKDKQIAENIVSEVFEGIWTKKPDYQNIKHLESYLRVSVKHLAIRMASRDPHRFSYSSYDESLEVSDSVDPENLLIAKELEEIVQSVLDGLPMNCRLIYDMVKTKGFSYQQIADELGISKRTVENQMYKVISKLKKRLEDHFGESGNQIHFRPGLGVLLIIIQGTLLGF
ncbi:MAG: sigma-70 family RNA polymerase sigma factor [Cyclobacteriaceae bacterium]